MQLYTKPPYFQGEKSASYIGALDRFRIVLHALIYETKFWSYFGKVGPKDRISALFSQNLPKKGKFHPLQWQQNFRSLQWHALIYETAYFFRSKKQCTSDSLLVHAPLPRFRIQVHAPQCGTKLSGGYCCGQI